jgi:hypothetical protein
MTIDRTSYSVCTKRSAHELTFSHFPVSVAGIWDSLPESRCHLDVPHDARSSDGSLLRSDCQRREL